ncbi:hypothetical protein AB1Y20_005330 [Prymnesium parvum]|uniref:NUP160 middle TPR domain-containing protein n=1 Tax=Prymnesium parvum TaxID=97485 RepID=A0AB34J3Y9_PRYPA
MARVRQCVASHFSADKADSAEVLLVGEADGGAYTPGAPPTAGGLFRAHGARLGHLLAWQSSGSFLKLHETCLLPGVSVSGGELKLQLPGDVLPDLGICQLSDDSLLLSIATSAAAGVEVWQLRFPKPADAQLTLDAVVARASWLAQASAPVPQLNYWRTTRPVCETLQTDAVVVCFSEQCEQGSLVGQLVLIGAASGSVTFAQIANTFDQETGGIEHIELELRTERSVLSSLSSKLITIGSSIGLTAGKPNAPLDPIAALRFINDGALLCALSLSSSGELKLWPLPSPASHAYPSFLKSPPALLLSHAPAPPSPTAAALLSTYHRDGFLALALHCSSGLYVSCRRAASELDVAEAVRSLSRVPQPLPADEAPLLRLSIAAAADRLVVHLLYATTPPSLFFATLRLAAPLDVQWEAAHLLSDDEADLALADAAAIRTADATPDGAPLSSLTEAYARRLLLPGRFPPRVLAAACHALLAPPAPPAASLDEYVRRGMEARVLELDSAALAASREESEREVGEAMLYWCAQRQRDPAELLCLAPLEPAGGVCALLTGSSLTLLCPLAPPLATAAQRLLCDAAALLSRRCAAAAAAAAWGESLGAAAQAPPLAAAAALLAAAPPLLSPPPSPPPPAAVALLAAGRWAAAAAAAALPLDDFFAAAHALLLAAAPPPPAAWAAAAWHARACAALRRAADADANAADERLAAAAAAAARRGGALCRGVQLLLAAALHARPASGLALQHELACLAPDGAAPLAARLGLACALLEWLAAFPADSADAHTALRALLRRASLPSAAAAPLLDGAPCAAALLALAHADVRLARGAAGPAEQAHSLGALLAAAGQWRALLAYVDRLRSDAPLHHLLAAFALLHQRRHDDAAARFALVARGADVPTLEALLAAAAAALPVYRLEYEVAPDGEEQRREWCIYQVLSIVWRSFREANQLQLLLPFAQLALRLPTLWLCAPRQCAALHSLVFSTALQLGRTREAHTALVGLGLRQDGTGSFTERRADCLRTLVSVLHERSCLHQLAQLPFVGELHQELQEALLWHARSADVSVTPGQPEVYEVAYALHVREKDYAAAAKIMFELAQRLERERLQQPGLDAQPARALLLATADAYGACLAALELVPPISRLLFEAGEMSRADRLRAALDSFHASKGAAAAPRVPMGTAPSPLLVCVEGYNEQQELIMRRESVGELAERMEAELRALQSAEGLPHALAAAEAHLVPVQPYEVRQRRTLALSRAALLDAEEPPDSGGVEPMALSVSADAPQYGGGAEPRVAEAAAVLHGLVRAERFDAAAALALAFARELDALAVSSRAPGGMALVVRRLAARCVAKDEQAAFGGGAAHGEWRRLQRLLERHDCEAANYELSAAAARAALDANPSRPLPPWLLRRFGAAPPRRGEAPLVLRLSGGVAREVGSEEEARREVRARVGRLLDKYPAAAAALSLRGAIGGGIDAAVTLPPPTSDEGAAQAEKLEAELRALDPGCWPLRRNPAALCGALIAHADAPAALKEALRQVEMGCVAALEEKRRWGGEEKQKRARWVTCGLIDKLHTAVAKHQGFAPWEADGTQPGPLQPELGRCFAAIERYLDIDLPQVWEPPMKAQLVANAAVDGEWDVEEPRFERDPSADQPRHMFQDEVFVQLLESAVRR